MKYILMICESRETCDAVRNSLGAEYRIDAVPNRDAASQSLRKRRFDFIFIDLRILYEISPDRDYKAAIQSFRQIISSIEIIVISPQEMIRDAVKAVKAGAADYLTYPVVPEEVRLVAETVHEAMIRQSELDYFRDKFWKIDALEVVHTNNPAMKIVFQNIRSVAPTKTTVLLTGETGTGKGVLAKLIHRHSNRENDQFISIHCGAIPDTLLESELFGHEKGAFTGAIRRKLGKFEIARNGTVFLDEISTITSSAQIKLLQVLQDGTFNRVGAEESIKTNARVIAATNNDLSIMCESGLFRKDLYYRLNVFPINIPPLRERPEDIPFLIDIFLKRLNQLNLKNIHDVHPRVSEAMQQYSWPGNIRELENLIERAYILEASSILTPESFPADLFKDRSSTAIFPMNSFIPLTEARRKAVEDFERQYIKELLSRNKGMMNKSAEDAGISVRQLNKLMLKYGIRKEEFKIRQ